MVDVRKSVYLFIHCFSNCNRTSWSGCKVGLVIFRSVVQLSVLSSILRDLTQECRIKFDWH